MKNAKRLFCLLLGLICLAGVLGGCAMTRSLTDREDSPKEVADMPALGFQFNYDGATYYLWDNGVATNDATYSADSNMTWEKNPATLELVVTNKIVGIEVARYAYRTMPSLVKPLNANGSTYYLWDDGLATSTESYTENAPFTWSCTNEVYHVYNSNGAEVASLESAQVIQKVYNGDTIYYLWDDTEEIKGYTQGVCTTKEEYDPSEGLRWTQPWDEYYMIYSGDYTDGHVVYTEHTCSYCNVHKIYYMRTIAEGSSLSKNFFCADCKLRFDDYYKKCPNCGTYWCYKEQDKCDYCISKGY